MDPNAFSLDKIKTISPGELEVAFETNGNSNWCFERDNDGKIRFQEVLENIPLIPGALVKINSILKHCQEPRLLIRTVEEEHGSTFLHTLILNSINIKQPEDYEGHCIQSYPESLSTVKFAIQMLLAKIKAELGEAEMKKFRGKTMYMLGSRSHDTPLSLLQLTHMSLCRCYLRKRGMVEGRWVRIDLQSNKNEFERCTQYNELNKIKDLFYQ